MFKFLPDWYKNLIVYEEASKLRALIFKITKDFPKDELRRVSQMRAAARSIKQNIVEGYKHGTVRQFRRFLNLINISDNSCNSIKNRLSVAKDLIRGLTGN